MIETKPRINCGNRGQLFRATWLSSARCSETFRRTTEQVECSAKCTWQRPRTGLNQIFFRSCVNLQHFRSRSLAVISLQIWRLHTITNLYKFVGNIMSNNSSTEDRTDLRLGQSPYLFMVYNVSIS